MYPYKEPEIEGSLMHLIYFIFIFIVSPTIYQPVACIQGLKAVISAPCTVFDVLISFIFQFIYSSTHVYSQPLEFQRRGLSIKRGHQKNTNGLCNACNLLLKYRETNSPFAWISLSCECLKNSSIHLLVY